MHKMNRTMNYVITGASRGIGYDLALLLASDPGNRVLVLSRDAAKLELLAKELDGVSGAGYFSYLPYDLSRPDASALLSAVSQMGGVDVVVNNAGALVNKPFVELSDADWRQVFDTNFFGPVALIRTLVPLLREGRQSHIVNISSMGGFQGSSKFRGLSAYSASKAALANLTECLAEELAEEGIAVNCLALGAVQTEMLAEAFPGYQAPLSSADMAGFIAYFATQGQRFFNGKVLPVSLSTP